MAYFDDAKELVSHAKKALPKLEQDYRSSLDDKVVKPTLLIDIKNIMENLRSALDFSAHGLFAKFGSSTRANPNIYFPYAVLRRTKPPSKLRTASRLAFPASRLLDRILWRVWSLSSITPIRRTDGSRCSWS